jgi:hypothetical protein
LTYEEIGARMGVSPQRAWKLCCQEFDRLNRERSEKAENVLRLELNRLDTLVAACYEKARGGDLRAINAMLKLIDKRAELCGLKLIKHEVTVSDEHHISVTTKRGGPMGSHRDVNAVPTAPKTILEQLPQSPLGPFGGLFRSPSDAARPTPGSITRSKSWSVKPHSGRPTREV